MKPIFKNSIGAQAAQDQPKKYTFKALEEGVEQLQIFGEIDESFGFGVKELAFELAISSSDKIEVLVNSPGGSVTEGNAIASILKGSNKEITTQGVGLVASIATMILLAGDKVKLASNGFFMIHNPWAYAVGEAQQLEATAEVLKAMQAQLLGEYVANIKKRGKLVNDSIEDTKAHIATLMNKESWLTAKEALNIGFIDEITEGAEFVNIANAQAYLDKLSKFKNTPTTLLNKVRAQLKKPSSKTLNKLRTKLNFKPQAGANLAKLANDAIEAMLANDEELTRANVVEQLATAADRSTSTINQILAGDIDDIPQEVQEAFIEVLGVTQVEVDTALEEDGVEEEGEAQGGGDQEEEEEEEEPIENSNNTETMNNSKKETGLWSFVKNLFVTNPEKVEEIQQEVKEEAQAQSTELAEARAILAKHGVKLPEEEKQEANLEAIIAKRVQAELAKASKDFDFNKDERTKRKGASKAGANQANAKVTKRKAHNKDRSKVFHNFKNYLVSRAEKG